MAEDMDKSRSSSPSTSESVVSILGTPRQEKSQLRRSRGQGNLQSNSRNRKPLKTDFSKYQTEITIPTAPASSAVSSMDQIGLAMDHPSTTPIHEDTLQEYTYLEESRESFIVESVDIDMDIAKRNSEAMFEQLAAEERSAATPGLRGKMCTPASYITEFSEMKSVDSR